MVSKEKWLWLWRSPVGPTGVKAKTGVAKEKAAMSKGGGGGAPTAKDVKALDKAAKAADKKADAADKKFQKSKSPADRKEAKRLDKIAKDANKKADAADKKFQAAQKRANTKKRQQAFEKELDKRKAKMKGATPKEQSRLISEASKAASDSTKMKNSFGQFDEVSYVAFMEAATEYYDFQTCQRSDGSSYGTGFQCRKGSPAEKPEKDKK